MTLIPTLFLAGLVQLVRSDDRKMPRGVMVSEFAAPNPNHLLGSPMLMNVFLAQAICVSATKKKKAEKQH